VSSNKNFGSPHHERSVYQKIEERNPYKFIEKVLQDARAKLDKMKGTP